MPMYEYRCQNGHEFEFRRGISEMDDPAKCPQCGKGGKRMTSVFASSNSGVGIMVPTKGAFRTPVPPKAPAARRPRKGKS